MPSFTSLLSNYLPVSVIGFGRASKLTPNETTKIAVIGGGIAGCGAAYSLKKSGFHVTLYEARKQLGGNAQVASFPPHGIKQDLSVLFWAKDYYKNYTCLLKTLNVKWEDVTVTYLLHTNA